MRQGPHSKRGRNRGGNRRPNTPNRNQTYDSNGPDVRIRGNAYQVHEKYLSLARDASASGDRILAESYFQHAEHYYRIIASFQDEQQSGDRNRLNGNGAHHPGGNGAQHGDDDDDERDQPGGQQGQQGQNGGGGLGTTTIQQPVVEQVTVTTTVSVPDGGTVLLGGVKRLREGRSMAGVPILNKLPYVSRLFKNTGVGRETESLMMMVTPRIIIQEEEEEALLGY